MSKATVYKKIVEQLDSVIKQTQAHIEVVNRMKWNPRVDGKPRSDLNETRELTMLKELLELSSKVLERWASTQSKVVNTCDEVAQTYSVKCFHLFDKYHETIEEIFKYAPSSFKIGSPIMWLDGELTISYSLMEYSFKMSTQYEVAFHNENYSLKTLGYQFKAVQSGRIKTRSSGRQAAITEKIVQYMTDEWFEKALAAELKRRMKAKEEETSKLLIEYGLK